MHEDYVTTEEAGKAFNPPLTAQQVLNRIKRGDPKFNGAKKFGWVWAVPRAVLPVPKKK